MAISEIYVDPSLAGDTGTGTRATITLTAATFTFAALSLTEVGAFASYTFVAGDRIYITGGTAVTAGYYTIASKTSDDVIVLTADITTDASSPADVTAATAPYGDLEFAIEQTTFDTTNGTRVNIKAGTDEILAADLTTALADTGTTIAWVPSELAPLYIQGYTAVAGDGGVGGISGGAGNFPILTASSSQRHILLLDLHMHNVGTATNLLSVNNYSVIARCEIDNVTGSGVSSGVSCLITNCYIHDCTVNGVMGNFDAITYCVFENGASKKFGSNGSAACIASSRLVDRNIFILDSVSDGINSGDYGAITNNSIYSNAGTGSGIVCQNAQGAFLIANNLIEGFSGTGGFGIDFVAATSYARMMRNNSVYNCLIAIDTPSMTPAESVGNETLTASPFTSASTGDFSPVDTGSVKEGSWPTAYLNA